MFDTHAHYDDEAFATDRDEVLASLAASGVELVVNVGTSPESSRASVELASRYPFVYAAVGIHPSETGGFNLDADIAELERLAAHPKCVAIGEIGFDYHYTDENSPDPDKTNPPRSVQRLAFEIQLKLAARLGKPVIIHDRDAHGDTMSVIKAAVAEFPALRGVLHCYSGSLEMAQELIKLGWYCSFTGVITFKNAKKFPEIIAKLPPDRLMIETDAPYLSPEPFRGKRNDSTRITHTNEEFARFRGLSPQESARLTAENGRRFFGL
jgi:TatD DNase family protein